MDNWQRVQIRYMRNAICLFLLIIFLQVIGFIVTSVGYFVVLFIGCHDVNDSLDKIVYMLMNDKDKYAIYVSLVSATIIFVLGLLVYTKSSVSPQKPDYKNAFRVSNLILVVMTAISSCLLLTVGLSAIEELIPAWFTKYDSMMSVMIDVSSVPTIIYLIIIGPMSEEMIFRGAIFSQVNHVFSFWIANTIQALLFGIYHMNVIQGIYAFLFGLVLGYIYMKTGTIILTIATHIIFNLTSLIFDGLYKYWKAPENLKYVIVFIVCTVIFYFSIISWKKRPVNTKS